MNIEGKVIHFLGDSITEGVGATDASHCFVSLIGRKTGAVVHNYGVGGTRIARQLNCPQDEGKDFCARFIEMEQGADMIMILRLKKGKRSFVFLLSARKAAAEKRRYRIMSS